MFSACASNFGGAPVSAVVLCLRSRTHNVHRMPSASAWWAAALPLPSDEMEAPMGVQPPPSQARPPRWCRVYAGCFALTSTSRARDLSPRRPAPWIEHASRSLTYNEPRFQANCTVRIPQGEWRRSAISSHMTKEMASLRHTSSLPSAPPRSIAPARVSIGNLSIPSAPLAAPPRAQAPLPVVCAACARLAAASMLATPATKPSATLAFRISARSRRKRGRRGGRRSSGETSIHGTSAETSSCQAALPFSTP
mmetsp:Transcript_109538/g.327459  ORF Transcript_109538/g.327459 Transcript_109538/m.327459 type:complete len:252 (-) Transcript_109538:212-967(-)